MSTNLYSLPYAEAVSYEKEVPTIKMSSATNDSSVIGYMRIGAHGFGCIKKQNDKITMVTMPFDEVFPFETYGKFKLAIVDIADLGFPSLQTNVSANHFFDHFKTTFLNLKTQLEAGTITYDVYEAIIQDKLYEYERIYITETLSLIDAKLSEAYEKVKPFWENEFIDKIFEGNFEVASLEGIISKFNEGMEELTDFLNRQRSRRRRRRIRGRICDKQ